MPKYLIHQQSASQRHTEHSHHYANFCHTLNTSRHSHSSTPPKPPTQLTYPYFQPWSLLSPTQNLAARLALFTAPTMPLAHANSPGSTRQTNRNHHRLDTLPLAQTDKNPTWCDRVPSSNHYATIVEACSKRSRTAAACRDRASQQKLWGFADAKLGIAQPFRASRSRRGLKVWIGAYRRLPRWGTPEQECLKIRHHFHQRWLKTDFGAGK